MQESTKRQREKNKPKNIKKIKKTKQKQKNTSYGAHIVHLCLSSGSQRVNVWEGNVQGGECCTPDNRTAANSSCAGG